MPSRSRASDGCVLRRPVNASRLLRLYMLGASAEPDGATDIRIEELPSNDAIAELIQCAHVLDVTDKNMLKVKFERLSALVQTVPCFRLTFPHDYSRPGEVCAAVIA